jgi:Na+/phosphate symporter
MNIIFSSYIQIEDFETLITSCFPHKKACIIEKLLADIFIIVPHGKKFTAYIKQDDKVRRYTHHIKTYLISIVTALLELSFKNLTTEEQHTIKNIFSKQYHHIFEGKAVNEYYRELFFKLIKHDSQIN